MISNQYQNQFNFQGNLLKKGVRLPQNKFDAVAKRYAERTIDKPNLILSGKQRISSKGQFYHATDVIIDGKKVASILTKWLKGMFTKCSSTKVAEELVNLSRRFDRTDKANVLKKEINGAKKRLLATKVSLEHTRNPEYVKTLQTLIDRMETSISNQEKRYNKIKPAEVSGEWCF